MKTLLLCLLASLLTWLGLMAWWPRSPLRGVEDCEYFDFGLVVPSGYYVRELSVHAGSGGGELDILPGAADTFARYRGTVSIPIPSGTSLNLSGAGAQRLEAGAEIRVAGIDSTFVSVCRARGSAL